MSFEATEFTDDHVYYNVVIANSSTIPIIANFSEQRTAALLKHPGQYHMAVVRFSVPATLIPLFIFPNPSTYYVTLSYGSNEYTTQVQYINNSLLSNTERNVYTVQSFLDMVNAAFVTAYTALTGSGASPIPPTAPFLVFDPVTQLISLYADSHYDPVFNSPNTTVKIWMNSPLYLRFGSFLVNFNGFSNGNKMDIQLLVQNTGVNQGTYINPNTPATSYTKMSQDTVSIGYMQDLKSIVFTSGTIPCKAEYIPSLNGNATDSYRKILIDFEPELSGSSAEPVGAIYYQYFPQGPLRLIDLQSNIPMSSVDVQVFWQDAFQNLYPIYIEPGKSLTMKLLFKKKCENVVLCNANSNSNPLPVFIAK